MCEEDDADDEDDAAVAVRCFDPSGEGVHDWNWDNQVNCFVYGCNPTGECNCPGCELGETKCDGNKVYTCGLFTGVKESLLYLHFNCNVWNDGIDCEYGCDTETGECKTEGNLLCKLFGWLFPSLCD